MSEVAYLCTCFVEEFCWERTCTNTCTVSLHYTIYIANAVRTNAQADASTCADGIRRSNKRIRTEVNIEHCALSTLAKNILTRTQNLVYLVLAIHNLELLKIFNAFHPYLLNLCNVEVGVTECCNLFEMSSFMRLILLLEVVENITHTQTTARNFIRISRTDTLTSCAYLVLTL